MIISSNSGPRTQPELNLGAHLFDDRQTPVYQRKGLGAHVFDERQNNMHLLRGLGDTSDNMRLWGWLSILSSGASAYHGYKRNGSIGWAIGWAALGAIFPVITPAIAAAQGFGKKK